MSLLFNGYNNYGFGRQVGSIGGLMPGALTGAGAWRFRGSAVSTSDDAIPRTGQTPGWSPPVKTKNGPAKLPLTGWYKPDAVNSTIANYSAWQSSESAGTSGKASRTLPFVAGATSGDPRNGRRPTNNLIFGLSPNADGAWSGLFTAAAGSISILFKAFRASGTAANAYDETALVTSYPNGAFGITFTTSGVRAFGISVTTGLNVDGAYVACSVGEWHQVDLKWDASGFSIRVDGGAWTTTTCAGGLLNAAYIGDSFLIGENYSGAGIFRGEIMEVQTAAVAHSDASFDSVTTYFNAEYDLALTTPSRPYDFWIKGDYVETGAGNNGRPGDLATLWRSTNTNAGDRSPVFDSYPGQVAPTEGTALNGHKPAVYSSSLSSFHTSTSYTNANDGDEQRQYNFQFGDFVNDNTGTIGVLFKPTAAAAPLTNPYDDPGILVMGGGGTAFGIHYTTGGLHIAWYDGQGPIGGWWKLLHSTACATGSWHSVVVRWDSYDGTDTVNVWLDGHLQSFSIGVGGTLQGATYPFANIYLGASFAIATVLDGEIMEVALSRAALSTAQVDTFRSDANTRYALSIGGYTRDIAETIGAPTIALARALIQARAIAESVTAPSASLARSQVLGRAVPESVGAPSAALARAGVFSRSIGESVSAPSAGLARATVQVRAVPESIAAPSDAVGRATVVSRAVPENVVAPTAGLARVYGASRSVPETVAGPSDSPARATVVARATAESVASPSAALARSTTVARGVPESVAAPSDAPTRATTTSRAIPETVSAPSAAIARAVVEARGISESIVQPADGLARAVVQARNAPETVAAPADSTARAVVVARATNETVSAPADVLARATVVARPTSESVAAPSAALGRVLGASRSTSESVAAPSDALARSLSEARAVAEALSAPTDSTGRDTAVSRSVPESVAAASDSLARAVVNSRAVSETTPAPGDGFARGFVGYRSIGESFGAPSDVVGYVKAGGGTFSRSVAESVLAPLDELARSVVVSRGLTENVAAPTEWLARSLSAFRSVDETIAGPVAGVTRVFDGSRLISEDLGALSDVVTALVVPALTEADAVITVSDKPLTRIRITDRPLTVVRITDRPLTRIHIMADFDIYYVGSVAILTQTYEVAEILTDPTTLTAVVRRYAPLPAGDPTTYTYGVDPELVKVVDPDDPQNGKFALSVDCIEAGEYSAFFEGTGVAKGTKAHYFKVLAAPS